MTVTADDNLGDYFEKQLQAKRHLTAMIEATPRARLAGQLLLELRCSRRCELLSLYATTFGIVGYRKSYKLSREKTRTDTAAGARASRTSDGERRWTGHAFLVDVVLEDATGQVVGLPVACDHLYAVAALESLRMWLRDVAPGAPKRLTIGAADVIPT